MSRHKRHSPKFYSQSYNQHMKHQLAIQNSPMSFVAMAFLLYFIGLPVVIMLLSSWFGSVSEVITDVVDLIPFGETFYELTIQSVNALGGQAIKCISMNGQHSFSYLLGETAKEIFTVIMFRALLLLVCIPLGFVDGGKIKPEGFWNKGKYALISAIVALLAACLAPIPMNWILSNMHTLSSGWFGFFSALLSAVLVGGGIAFFAVILSLSIGKAIAYVVINFFLVGALKISVSYLAILFILVGYQSKLYLLSANGIIMLLMLAVILGAIEMILSSVFE